MKYKYTDYRRMKYRYCVPEIKGYLNLCLKCQRLEKINEILK